jgi:hypothetical protein
MLYIYIQTDMIHVIGQSRHSSISSWKPITPKFAPNSTLKPAYVGLEFEDFLRCGRLEHGFLRVRCEGCKHKHLVAFSPASMTQQGRRIRRLCSSAKLHLRLDRQRLAATARQEELRLLFPSSAKNAANLRGRASEVLAKGRILASAG